MTDGGRLLRAFKRHIKRKRGDCFALAGLAMTAGGEEIASGFQESH
jgi:hypothetical protein